MSPSSLSRRPCAAAALVLIIAVAASSAFGQTLTWSGSAGATWNTSPTNWSSWTGTGGPWDSTNGAASIADFVNGGDSPVVNGTVYANGLQFDNTASIQSGTINLVTGTLTVPTITVNASGGTIGSIIAGSAGLAKAGSGILVVSGANTYTGPTAINNGTLALSGTIAGGGTIYVGNGAAGAGGALQIVQSGTNSNTLVLNGGTVSGSANAQNNIGSGGTITLTGGEVIHAFTATGGSSLVLPMSETAQVLVVGGGGGGGAASDRTGGGGGGGGVLYNSSASLAASTYTVTVGAGGTGAVNGGAGATNGGTSVFGSMTAYGGGSGADSNHLQAGTGNGTVGSGGGAYHNASSHLGVGTTGQGNSGGSGYDSGNGSKYFFAGGGGGAGAAGTSANSSSTGAGGNGVSYNISGATVYYGGGGGGGVQNNGSYSYSAASGGLGGGGTGGVGGGAGSTIAAAAGTNGLGGGGGGGGNGGNGAAGGSGVVIVSYAYVGGGPVVLSGAISVPVTSTLDTGSLAGLVVNSAMTGAGGINITSSAGPGGVVSYAVAQGYTGGTTVNANGTLQLQVSNALSYGAGTGNMSVNGTLDLDGQATTNVNGLSGSGTITSTAAGTPLLVVGNNAASSAFGGVIQNGIATLGLTMAGPGMLTLTGANTYSGGTTINQGTLQIGNGSVNGTIGSGTYSLASAGKLYLNYATASPSNFGNITGAGTLELNAANSGEWSNTSLPGGFTGTIQIDTGNLWDNIGNATAIVVNSGGRFAAAAGTFTQNFTIAGNGLADGYPAAIRLWGNSIISGNVTLSASATIGCDNQNGTISGVIAGPSNAALTIGGGNLTSTVVFSGNSSNTYAGTTIVAAGVLNLSKTGAVAVPGNVTFGTGSNSINPYIRTFQNNQFSTGSVMSFVNQAGGYTRFELQGTQQTLAGISDSIGAGVAQNSENGVGGTSTLTLDPAVGASYWSDSYVRNGSAGVLSLTMAGPGMQTLAGGNVNYTGATTINGGTLGLQDTTGFNSAINVGAGGTLNLVRSSAGFSNRSNIAANTIAGSGVIDVNNAANSAGNTDGGWVRTSGLNFSGTINVNSGVFGTDGGAIQGTATVNVASGAVFTNHSGSITIGALNGSGVVTPAQVGNGTYAFTVGNGDGSGTFSGTIYGANTTSGTDGSLDAGYLALYKTGAGTEVLTGNNTFDGQPSIGASVFIYQGVLSTNNIQNGGTASGLGSNGSIALLGGALQYTGAGATTNRRIELGNTGGTIDASGTGPLVYNSAGIGGAGQSGNRTLTLTGSNTGANTLNTAVNNQGGTLSVVKNGPGTWVLQNTLIDYSGSTQVQNGRLVFQDLDDLWSASIATNSGATVEFNGTAHSFTINGNTTVSGAGTFVKSGNQTFTTGASGGHFTWAMTGGLIDIQGGTFNNDWNDVPTSWTSNLASMNIDAGATVNMVGGNNINVDALTGGGTVTDNNSWGTGVFTVGVNGGSGTFSGTILNGTGVALTKTGAGIQTLTGANTYAGATTVSGGTLAIAGAGVLGGGNYAGAIANNAALVVNSSTNQTFSGAISGAGSLTQSGNNVLTLSGNNASYTGPASVSGGTLEVANVAAAPAGSAVAVGPSTATQARCGRRNAQFAQRRKRFDARPSLDGNHGHGADQRPDFRFDAVGYRQARPRQRAFSRQHL